MRDFAGKVAVVTGSGGGIGLATARLLGQRGMRVVLADINEQKLKTAVEGCQRDGLDVVGVRTDVSDFDSMSKLQEATISEYGPVTLLHLNAGIGGQASLFDRDTDAWTRTIGVNLLGVIWGIKAFVPAMVESGEEGLVLATSSGAGADGTSYMASAYAATKNAVVSIMESLYGQLRDQNSRIRAGIVFPPLTATYLSGDPETMKFVESHLQSTGVPAVLVQPEQVAAMIVDGIERDRFFIRVGEQENKDFFDGAHPAEFFTWNERMVRGRAEAQVSDGRPDPYLW
jgi:NAD(P)-dependent dehydrogenase (short-subunit alcohol dehydrogenase family)